MPAVCTSGSSILDHIVHTWPDFMQDHLLRLCPAHKQPAICVLLAQPVPRATDDAQSVLPQDTASKGAPAAGPSAADRDRSAAPAAALAPKAATGRVPMDTDVVIVLSSDSDEAVAPAPAPAPAQPPRQQPPRPPSSDDDVTSSPTKYTGGAAQGRAEASVAASSPDPLLKVFRQVSGRRSAHLLPWKGAIAVIASPFTSPEQIFIDGRTMPSDLRRASAGHSSTDVS